VAVSQSTRTLGVSIALHAAIAGLILLVAGERILSSIDESEYVEVELLPEEILKPPEKVEEPPEEVEIPTEKRPAVVPRRVEVRTESEPRPFQEEGQPGEREAPEDAEAIPLPRTLSFAMEQDVGGASGLDYQSNGHGSMALPPPGPKGGLPGEGDSLGASNVQVARDWQVTSQPTALNARAFEPDYPPLAKRQGREATVVVSLDIDATGKVVRADVLEGPAGHGFRKAALAYVKKLRFEPARSGESKVASRIDWTVLFYVRN
jgi:protein TonB